MDDKKLIEKVMEKKGWNQSDIANRLGLDKSNVTRYLQGIQRLHAMSREALRKELENKI